MDRFQRQLIHELAKFYKIDTESFDNEPQRNVVVTKRKDSRIPAILLSAVLVNNSIRQMNLHNYTGNCTLLIYDLNPDIKTQHLISYLNPFAGHYQLKWLDDYNALVLFRDNKTTNSALQFLSSGPFQVKLYGDDSPSSPEAPKPFVERPLKKPVKAQEAPWVKNKNPFEPLNQSDTWNEEGEIQKRDHQLAAIQEMKNENTPTAPKQSMEQPKLESSSSLDNWEDFS